MTPVSERQLKRDAVLLLDLDGVRVFLRFEIRIRDAGIILVVHDLRGIGSRIDNEKCPAWRGQEKPVERMPCASVEGIALFRIDEKRTYLIWFGDGLRVVQISRGSRADHRWRPAHLNEALGHAKMAFQLGKLNALLRLPDDIDGRPAVHLKIDGKECTGSLGRSLASMRVP